MEQIKQTHEYISQNGKKLCIGSVAPLDLYLYKDGYINLIKYIKTSPHKTIIFLSSHHLTPFHHVLKYKNDKGYIFILSRDNIYDFVKSKKEKYKSICITRNLTLYERERFIHYIIMKNKLDKFINRILCKNNKIIN
jgi:hypothetical protein